MHAFSPLILVIHNYYKKIRTPVFAFMITLLAGWQVIVNFRCSWNSSLWLFATAVTELLPRHVDMWPTTGLFAHSGSLFSVLPVISLLVVKAIIISVMSKDILMAAMPLLRIIKARSQGLAEEGIKASLVNRGGRRRANGSRPSKCSHTFMLLILIWLNPP